MKKPLIKNRPILITEFVADIRRSSKALVFETFPYFDEKSFDIFVNEGLFKHGYDAYLVEERIAAIGKPATDKECYEFLQLKVHQIMMLTDFALEYKDNLESDYAWLCLLEATNAKIALHILFAGFKGVGDLAKAIKRKNASNGGVKRGQKYDPLKQELLKILKERVEKDGKKLRSAYFAAGLLQDEALEIAEELNIPIEPESIKTRRQEWFNDFPERDALFASKRTGNASKATTAAK